MPPSTDDFEIGIGRTRWFAVTTQPKCETWAITHLDRQGFATRISRRCVDGRHACRQMAVTRSFFPNCVFVRLNPTRDRWRSVNGSHGVRAPVLQGDMPLQSFERGRCSRCLSMQLGRRIAYVENATGERRLKVLLEMVDGHLPVTVDRSELVRAV